MSKQVILNFVGSLDSDDLFQRSLLYTRQVKQFENYNFIYIMCYPDETFSSPSDLNEDTLNNSEKFTIERIGAMIKTITPDLMLMQAFGFNTCTKYRQVFENLGAPSPFMGPQTKFHIICSDKVQTRELLESFGQSVAPGVTITRDKKDNRIHLPFNFPVVVKIPILEDSEGITLCSNKEDMDVAVDKALDFGESVIIEQFIKGRELRAAVIEDKTGDLSLLGIVEYGVDPNGIRELGHKYTKNKNGKGVNVYTESRWFLDPNEEPKTVNEVKDVIFKAFRAIGLQDWALFDLRMDEDGKIYILEINLFHSFSEVGQIARMGEHVGISNHKCFDMMVKKAMKRAN